LNQAPDLPVSQTQDPIGQDRHRPDTKHKRNKNQFSAKSSLNQAVNPHVHQLQEHEQQASLNQAVNPHVHQLQEHEQQDSLNQVVNPHVHQLQ
jgi:hypothetical protein